MERIGRPLTLTLTHSFTHSCALTHTHTHSFTHAHLRTLTHLSAAWWLIATLYMWLGLPVVFRPANLGTPLSPLWPSAGVLTTIFLIGAPRRA